MVCFNLILTSQPPSLQSSYHTGYEDSSDSLIIGLGVTTGVLLLVSVVYAVIKTTGYIRRSGVVYCDIGVRALRNIIELTCRSG